MPQPSTTFSFTFNQGPKAMATSSNNSVPPIAQSFFSGTPISKSDTQLAFTQPSFTFNTKSTLAKNIQPVPKTEVQSQQINLLDKGQVSKQASDPRLVDEKSVNMNTKILEKLEEQTEIDRNETELLIAQMVKEECAMLESEFKAFVKHKQGVKIDLGTETEATNLVQSTNQLQDFVEEISEICQAQSTEVFSFINISYH